MSFTNENLLTVLGIVNIFETSRPLGDYAACVVLNDGAGVSYGINQFTHRSSALHAVVERYLAAGGQVERETLTRSLPVLKKRTNAAIARLASDETFKRALRNAAAAVEMREAQEATAFELYLKPAIDICDRRGFELPLSLAVVYDSITHGSFERIAKRIARNDEKAWITEYVRARHAWLTRISRLKATNYRTKFFLDQIAVSNWQLKLPLRVHGVTLSELPVSGGGQFDKPRSGNDGSPTTSIAAAGDTSASDLVTTAAEKFDRVDSVITTVAARSDRAKSLWTTVGGTLWQTAWAIFGFFAELPREIWIVVAVIAGLLMLLFLYRQITLGRIREHLNADR